MAAVTERLEIRERFVGQRTGARASVIDTAVGVNKIEDALDVTLLLSSLKNLDDSLSRACLAFSK
ncbi:MAG: hypothetical protein NT028_05735 [candidate division Zixibacteria bacterium]|nr:hypothetical protein [candidate division Zixibacteria bacterium]